MINKEKLLLYFLRNVRRLRLPSSTGKSTLAEDYSPNNPLNLKTKPLNIIARTLEARSSVLFYATKTKTRALKISILGDKRYWTSLEDELAVDLDHTLSRQIFPILPPARTRYGATRPLGYIGIEKPEGFSNEEITLLKEAVDFYSDYVVEVMRIATARDSHFAFNSISKYGTSKYTRNSKPGTIVVNTHGKLHRALSSWQSHYSIIDDNKIYIEYSQYSRHVRPKVNRSPLVVQIPHYLSQRIMESDRFFWMDKDRAFNLPSQISQAQDQSDKWIYYFLVYKNDNHPLAASIFMFQSGELLFIEEYYDTLSLAQQRLQIPSKYLFQRRTSQLIVNPIYKHRDTRVDEQLAFVIMPFGESWSSRIWQKILTPIIEGEGMTPLRADDLYGRDIMEDIWKGILSSKVVIADITTRNANVFYELGIAHTIGKQVILLTQKVEDIPFDLNRYRHIVYQDNLDGYEKLEKELKMSIRDILAA